MTIHSVHQPDLQADGAPRLLLWNDETGEVSGEHSDVPLIRGYMKDAVRDGGLPVDNGFWRLRDPRHDPASFVVVLSFAIQPAFDENALPEALRFSWSDLRGEMFEPAHLEPGMVF